jgi:hypothetical protein
MQGPSFPEDPQQQPQPQQGAQPTLDQVTQQMDPTAPMADPYQRREALRAYHLSRAQSQLRPDVPDIDKPGMLKNFFTFGEAGRYYNDYRRGYSIGVRKYNQHVLDKAEKDADALADDYAQRDAALLTAGKADHAAGLAELNARLRMLEVERSGRQQRFGMTEPPPTPDRRAAAADEGLEWKPNEEFGPGRGEYVRKPGLANVQPAPYRPTSPDSPLRDLSKPPVGSAAQVPDAYTQEALAGKHGTAAKLAAEARQKRDEQKADIESKPLDSEDRKFVFQMDSMREIVRKMKTEFTPEQLAKYTGIFNYYGAKAKQLVRNDPDFARFDALLGSFGETLFQKAGAALTETELEVLKKGLPTGLEWGGGEQLEQKLRRLYQSSLDLKRQRLDAARSRDTIEQETATESGDLDAVTPVPPAESAPAAPAKRLSLDEFLAE